MINCQKEDDGTNTVHKEFKTNNPITAHYISGDSLIKQDLSVQRILKNFTKKNSSLRTIQSDALGFGIDTTMVQLIETDTYKSYTFSVERSYKDPDLIENYVLTKYNDSTFSQLLIGYPILYINDELEYDIANANVTIIEDNSLVYFRNGNCASLVEYVDGVCISKKCQDPGGAAHEIGVGNWFNCRFLGGPWGPTLTCTDGAWVDTGCPDQNGSTSPGTGSTGGNGTINTNSDAENEALFVTVFAEYLNNIDSCINGPAIIGQSNNTTISLRLLNSISNKQAHAIDNYLNSNGCSEPAQAFAIAAIQALQDNNEDGLPDGEVDFEDLLIIDPTFKNNPKAKCVYDRMKSLNGSVFSDLLSQFDNSKNAKLTFKVANIPQTNPTVNYNAKTLPRFLGGNLRTFDIILDEQFVQNASLIEISLTLVHEMIHAEIMERCIQLGIITALNYNSNWEVSLSFSNGAATSTNLPSILFAHLVSNYSNYLGTTPNSSSNWQHDLYNVTNYRSRIAQNLSQVHPLLNDTTNPFENNLNNGTIINLTMNEYFNLISWLGLEGTQEYNNLSGLEQTKKAQAFNQTELYYNNNCN